MGRRAGVTGEQRRRRRVDVDLDGGAVTTHWSDGTLDVLPLADPSAFEAVSDAWLRAGWDTRFVYGFTWLGRPVIQLPEDLVRLQEAIVAVRPEVIIETGVAHGGTTVFLASLCEVLGGRVIAVEVDLRPANRAALAEHPLAHRIDVVDGSSTDPTTIRRVHELASGASRVLVLLDSNHRRDHVLAELEAYAPLISPGSWIIAADGIMQDVVGAPGTTAEWAWDNPCAAVSTFLKRHPEFEHAEPVRPFDEGVGAATPSYWRGGWLRRRS